MSTSFRKRDTCSIRELAQFIGTLTAACPAVKYGWLYTKRLEQLKCSALEANNYNYNCIVVLPHNFIHIDNDLICSTHPLANRLTLVAAKLSGRGFN
ncbi:unnamed protein product [Acanthoscelides obtectus]|uniref:Uncharacterized protein n=1 Tax=Acanthoscelides obtectus TaxID=200917 RepID=A0A9P0Q848_ACAOB|nr:unnamed protein product [Acanthoscelides obtectus]CAK1626096.1 hypothetical protein AOBTE_LOCUS3606 [Acanthoscelides obtectus]